MEALVPQRTPRTFTENCNALLWNVQATTSPDGAPPQSERDDSADTLIGNRAPVSKPIEITDRAILVCHQRRRKHPSVMRKIWKAPAGFSPEFRENQCLRHILNIWNVLNDWNDRLPIGGQTIKRARVCICLMLLVNYCILSAECCWNFCLVASARDPSLGFCRYPQVCSDWQFE
jgi:hypothetical protein